MSISAGNAVLDEPKSTVIGTRHIKHYALSIEKSLMKKLNSTKRKQISYKFTGGGLTAELKFDRSNPSWILPPLERLTKRSEKYQ
jgi:hypothetical protein